jgi:hypothetical protein
MLHKLIFLLGLAAIGWPGAALVDAMALPCDLNVPFTYATIGAAVTAASNGQVICVAAGSYTDAFFDLATKGLTMQGAQAGVDARTRPARLWAVGDPLPVATETVFTYSGQNFFTIVGGFGATVDGIFMQNIGQRALDQQGSGDVLSLTIKNSILKSTDPFTGNSGDGGIVQFGAGPTRFSDNVWLEQNYIETFQRTFLYASTRCNDWTIKDNEIVSYYFGFGPFAGDRNGYPGGISIHGNQFLGTIPGSPPPRASSPPGYDALAFNAVLGNAVITENTFHKVIGGLGSVWLYDGVVQGNTFRDNYLRAMALWGSDTSSPPKPPSSDVNITNNIIEYNGTPLTNGDNANFLSQGILINRNAGGTTPVDASTIHINFNSLIDLGLSGGTQVWAIRQDGVGTANAMVNYWGPSTSDIRVNGSVEVSPWIVSYQDDPNKLGDPGFWPINIVYGAPEGEPVPIPIGTDVSVDFFSNTSTESMGNITFGEVTTAGVTVRRVVSFFFFFLM